MIGRLAMHTITWRLHLGSSPAEAYDLLATGEGRRRFWASSAEETEGEIEFRFSNGARLESRITVAEPPHRFGLTYFDESLVLFRLTDDGAGGTDLTLTEEGVSDANLLENLPGWVTLLLNLKAALDHGIDLRNHDPERTWERGYVDV